MLAEGLSGSSYQRAVEIQVTGFAAVDDAQLGNPYLANAYVKITDQGAGLAVGGQLEVRLLVMAPVAEIILRRRNCQRDQQEQAHHAKGGKLAARGTASHQTRLIVCVHPSLSMFIQVAAHSTSPGNYPRPARAAEKCAHCSKQNQLHHEPRHKPEGERAAGKPTPESLGRLRRAARRPQQGS